MAQKIQEMGSVLDRSLLARPSLVFFLGSGWRAIKPSKFLVVCQRLEEMRIVQYVCSRISNVLQLLLYPTLKPEPVGPRRPRGSERPDQAFRFGR